MHPCIIIMLLFPHRSIPSLPFVHAAQGFNKSKRWQNYNLSPPPLPPDVCSSPPYTHTTHTHTSIMSSPSLPLLALSLSLYFLHSHHHLCLIILIMLVFVVKSIMGGIGYIQWNWIYTVKPLLATWTLSMKITFQPTLFLWKWSPHLWASWKRSSWL